MGAHFQSVFYVNTLPCITLIMFLFILAFNSVFDRRQTRLFFISAAISLGMIVIISLDYLLSVGRQPGTYLVRRFTSFCNFAFSPIIPMLLCRISELRPSSWRCYIPATLNAILCGISAFNGIVFYISPNNGYDRGSLFFIPFAISLLYIFMLIIQPRQHAKGKKFEQGYLLAVALLLLLGMFMEIVFKYRFLTWDFTMPAIILYYLLLNIQSAILDSLTGAYNRRMYDKQLSTIDGRKSCELAMLDINGFKAINDLQGHDVGDRYLITLAEILSKNFSATATVFRVGGDEFVIISKKQDVQRFADSMTNARKEAAAQGIEFACGILTYKPSQPLHESVVEVDRLMYEDKKQKEYVR